MIAAVIGTTRLLSDGAATLTPSIADSAEIAGVIMLSPKKREAPKTPSAASVSFVRRPPGHTPAPDQGDERQDPAFAIIVGSHDEQHVGDSDDDRHRPEDERDDPEDALPGHRHRMRVVRVEHRLNGVERTRTDVAEDDPERADRKSSLSGGAPGHPTIFATRCTMPGNLCRTARVAVTPADDGPGVPFTKALSPERALE